MIEFDMAQLRAIGLSQYIVQQLAGLTPEDRKLALMRVVEVQRDLLRLHDGVETHTARILPPLLVESGVVETCEFGAVVTTGGRPVSRFRS